MAYITECGDPVFILYLLIDTYLLPTYNRVSLTASSYSKNASFSVPKRSDISSHEDQWEEMSDDEAIEDDLSDLLTKNLKLSSVMRLVRSLVVIVLLTGRCIIFKQQFKSFVMEEGHVSQPKPVKYVFMGKL